MTKEHAELLIGDADIDIESETTGQNKIAENIFKFKLIFAIITTSQPSLRVSHKQFLSPPRPSAASSSAV